MKKFLAAAILFSSFTATTAFAGSNLSETFYRLESPPQVEQSNCSYSRIQILVNFTTLEWRILETCN